MATTVDVTVGATFEFLSGPTSGAWVGDYRFHTDAAEHTVRFGSGITTAGFSWTIPPEAEFVMVSPQSSSTAGYVVTLQDAASTVNGLAMNSTGVLMLLHPRPGVLSVLATTAGTTVSVVVRWG